MMFNDFLIINDLYDVRLFPLLNGRSKQGKTIKLFQRIKRDRKLHKHSFQDIRTYQNAIYEMTNMTLDLNKKERQYNYVGGLKGTENYSSTSSKVYRNVQLDSQF